VSLAPTCTSAWPSSLKTDARRAGVPARGVAACLSRCSAVRAHRPDACIVSPRVASHGIAARRIDSAARRAKRSSCC